MANKIILITGGGRGIGAVTALMAAKVGYDVCVNYARDVASAGTVAAACRSEGVRAIAVEADIACEEDVTRLFNVCDSELGPVSHLVNNAGILGAATRLAQIEAEVIRNVMDVNVVGTMLCAKQAVLRMSDKNGGAGGAIVNISSIAATIGSPGEYIHYAASKAAVDAFTVGLAKEVGPEGIRVNAVQAGTVDTSIHHNGGNPDRPAMVAATAPLGRVAEAEDIAKAVLWLLSDDASYTTGAILRVGGGL